MPALSVGTQKAPKSCGLLEGNALRLLADFKKRCTLGVVPENQMPFPPDFTAAGKKQPSKK